MVAAAMPAQGDRKKREERERQSADARRPPQQRTFVKSTTPTFFQGLADLGRVGRQVQVGAVGLQVADGTVPACHAEALDEQPCKHEGRKAQCAAADDHHLHQSNVLLAGFDLQSFLLHHVLD